MTAQDIELHDVIGSLAFQGGVWLSVEQKLWFFFKLIKMGSQALNKRFSNLAVEHPYLASYERFLGERQKALYAK